jgi:hypothetical protein
MRNNAINDFPEDAQNEWPYFDGLWENITTPMHSNPARVTSREYRTQLFRAKLIVCRHCGLNRGENAKHRDKHGRNNRYKNHRG